MNRTTTRQNLTRLSAREIAALIRSGDVSAREATDAHIDRLEAVNPKLNAVAVRRYQEARAEADRVDARRRAGQNLGPLGGVPISVKECFELTGTPCTIGNTNRVGIVAPQDGILVSRLREAGAVIVAKGNIPQAMVSVECNNPVYGRTNNPWDVARAPGGSSGGDAAIVAAGGAALALGSDIGGSLRIPAHACGIHTLKPTSRRMALVGAYDVLNRQEGFPSQAGPLARCVADLALAMEILAAPGLERVDPGVPPVPWRGPDDVDVGSLRVGFYESDGFFDPAPALRRAVREAAEALRGMGASVEPYRPHRVDRVIHLFMALLSADGGAGLARAGGDSPRDAYLALLEKVARLNPAMRALLRLVAVSTGQVSSVRVLDALRRRTVDEYWGLLEERKALLRGLVADLDERGLDVIIGPPSPLPALLHDASLELGPVYCYTAYYNVLGFPAGVVTATRVRPGEESDRPPSRDRAMIVAKNVEQGSAGLPVGVQVVARPWREDLVLAVMAALERHFRSQPDYPAWPPV